jgi:hypothetical protein
MATRWTQNVLILIAGLACTGVVRANSWDDPAALGGPKVGESSVGKATLVERNFDGTMKMLDVRPEVAGLRLLKLTEMEKSETDKVVQQRGAQVAKVLKENYALFLELQNLRQGGFGGGGGAKADGTAGAEGRDKEKQREQRRGMMEEMQTFREIAKDLLEPTLLTQLSESLSISNAEELKRLVQEYDAAAMETQPAERGQRRQGGGVGSGGGGGQGGGMGGKYPGDRGDFAAQRMEISHTLREIGRSLRAIVDDRKDRADAMLKAANATPEQEAKIRTIFRELGSKAATGEPSEKDRGTALRKVMEILTPEQREAVLKEIRR